MSHIVTPQLLEQLLELPPLIVAEPYLTDEFQVKFVLACIGLILVAKERLLDDPSQMTMLPAVPTGVWLMVTCWVTVSVFPFPSCAVQSTAVLPKPNVDGALFVKVTVPQLSVPVGLPKVTEIGAVKLHCVISAGAVMVGTKSSCTITV